MTAGWDEYGQDLNLASLDVIQGDLHVDSVWPGDSEEKIAAMQATIHRAREWVRTVTDLRIREAYSGWLDFYEARVRAAREELTTHAEHKRREQFGLEFEQRRKRVNDLSRTLPRPSIQTR